MSNLQMTQRDDSSTKGKGGRRIYTYPFVNRKLQFTFAGILALIGIGNALYITVLFFFYTQGTFAIILPYIPEYIQAEILVDQQMRIFLLTIAFIVLPEIALIVLWGLFFSHRLAGPLFSMTRTLKEIARGEVPQPVRIRKNDLLNEFADDMNKAISELTRQRQEVEASLKEIQEGRVEEGKQRLEKAILPESTPESS